MGDISWKGKYARNSSANCAIGSYLEELYTITSFTSCTIITWIFVHMSNGVIIACPAYWARSKIIGFECERRSIAADYIYL